MMCKEETHPLTIRDERGNFVYLRDGEVLATGAGMFFAGSGPIACDCQLERIAALEARLAKAADLIEMARNPETVSEREFRAALAEWEGKSDCKCGTGDHHSVECYLGLEEPTEGEGK